MRGTIEIVNQQKGQSVVEMAIIMPLMLLIIMIMVFLGIFIFDKSVVLLAAHQGAREALNFRTNTNYSEDQKNQFVRQAVSTTLRALPAGASTPIVDLIKDDTTGLVNIRVTYYFKLNLPYIKEIINRDSIPVQSEVFYRFAPPNP